jgi:hypothetical protein
MRTCAVAAQRAALQAIVDVAQSALKELDPLRVPYQGKPDFTEQSDGK